MDFYGYWRRYGTFFAVNLVVLSIVVQFLIRGSWRVSGLVMLLLVVSDLLVGRALRSRRRNIAQTYSKGQGGRFFRLYGYALMAGGLVWLAVRIRGGITWGTFAPFVILVLLATAMLSIGNGENS
jgi:hypothetical protein